MEAAQLADSLADSTDPEVLLSVAQCQYNGGDPESALAFAEQAASLASGASAAAAHDKCSWLLRLLGRPDEAVERALQALALSGRPPAMYLLHLANALEEGGDIEGADARRQEGIALAEQSGLVGVLIKGLASQAWAELRLGRAEAAATSADMAQAVSEQYGIRSDMPDPRLVTAWLALRDGRIDATDLAAALEENASARSVHLASIRLRVATDAGDHAEAGRLAATVIECHGPSYRGPLAGSLPDATRAAIAAGEHGLAQEGLARAERLARTATGAGALLIRHRCRTLVSRSAEEAVRVVELARQLPWPVERGGGLEDAAEVLGDSRRALLAEAAAAYESAGSQPDLARVRTKLGRRVSTAGTARRPVTGWGALTPAERDVALLATEGLTNREIGERLFVSHRTVGTHLAHAYDKLGIRSRVELAREVAAGRVGRQAEQAT